MIRAGQDRGEVGRELYFLVADAHPAWGYPDQPPLTPLLAWARSGLLAAALASTAAVSVTAQRRPSRSAWTGRRWMSCSPA